MGFGWVKHLYIVRYGGYGRKQKFPNHFYISPPLSRQVLIDVKKLFVDYRLAAKGGDKMAFAPPPKTDSKQFILTC